MESYTADAVALLAYLVDALPREADRVFSAAEAGEAVVLTPGTALAEALYAVSRDKDVRGVVLTGTPEKARQALVANGPVSVSAIGEEELVAFAEVVEEFSLHDALVVASHQVDGTEAVITSDGVIAEAGCETIWSS